MCLQSHSKPECRWTGPEVAISVTEPKDRGVWEREWGHIEQSCPKTHRVLPPPIQRLMAMLVCLLGQICRYSRTFLFLFDLTDLSHCIPLKAIVKVSYMRKHLFFNVEPLVSIYIYYTQKNNIIVAFFGSFFANIFSSYCTLKLLFLSHLRFLAGLEKFLPSLMM